MKIFFLVAFLLGLIMEAKASLYAVGSIPDGNPVGASFAGSYTDADAGATVSGLTVNLTVSGGYNGNLYAYLVAPNGMLVTLLNQPGVTGGNPFGYAGSGLNVTLSDAAAGSIQATAETAGEVFSGTYLAAGTLANFNGSMADGTWTLFFADTMTGGGQAQLTDWSLDITAVPEPVNMALAIFGVSLVGAVGVQRYLRRRPSSSRD
jgi:subtilisin-like proprotein convertase family protein